MVLSYSLFHILKARIWLRWGFLYTNTKGYVCMSWVVPVCCLFHFGIFFVNCEPIFRAHQLECNKVDLTNWLIIKVHSQSSDTSSNVFILRTSHSKVHSPMCCWWGENGLRGTSYRSIFDLFDWFENELDNDDIGKNVVK